MPIQNAVRSLRVSEILSKVQAHKKQILRYLLVGGSSALVDFGVFVAAYHALRDMDRVLFLYSEQAANILALSISFVYSFTLHRIWSFQSKGNPLREFILVGFLVLFNTAFTSMLISVLVRGVAMDARLAKLLLQALIVCWNYLVFHYWIYSPRARIKAAEQSGNNATPPSINPRKI